MKSMFLLSQNFSSNVQILLHLPSIKKKHIIQHQCKKNYPREPFYVIKIAPSPTKIIISRIVNINKNIRIVCLQSLQTIHNYQNYAYKVVYPSVYYRKKITHINYI